jgi:hypothetical protein
MRLGLRNRSCKTSTARIKHYSSSETANVGIFEMQISAVTTTFQVVVELEYFAKESH